MLIVKPMNCTVKFYRKEVYEKNYFWNSEFADWWSRESTYRFSKQALTINSILQFLPYMTTEN